MRVVSKLDGILADITETSRCSVAGSLHRLPYLVGENATLRDLRVMLS
jgi:hypothetical protein